MELYMLEKRGDLQIQESRKQIQVACVFVAVGHRTETEKMPAWAISPA